MTDAEWPGPLLSISAGGQPGRALGPSRGARTEGRDASHRPGSPMNSPGASVSQGHQAECWLSPIHLLKG